MSSLAASRADNFYYPPNWRPELGSISKFQGSKGKNQYEQKGIIRFELPLNGVCLSCDAVITRGNRFNARKEHTGNYFSTKIWSFYMKCCFCNSDIVIATNPKNNTYDYVAGIRKQEKEYEVDEINDDVIVLASEEERAEMRNNPMMRLEKDNENENKVKSVKRRLEELIEYNQSTSKDNFTMNSILRKRNRTIKQEDKQMFAAGKQRGLNVKLLQMNDDDARQAKEMLLLSDHADTALKKKQNEQRETILQQPIFKGAISSTADSSSKSSKSHTSARIIDRSIQLSSALALKITPKRKL